VTDLGYRSATDLVAALKAKDVGSRELLDHLLDRIDRFNPGVNAVVTLDVERARAAADAADEATARGEDLGPLHGLPMTVKDCFETAGVRTTCGTPELTDHVPDTDATSVARLKGAGAIVFGKTNTPAWTMDLQTYNPIFGVTGNPWDPALMAGGSSGGAAAALGAGLTPLELGSDIGGSIRNPSHQCGTYGHKPSYGIVPVRGHLPGRPGTLGRADINVCGPMARSVEDLVLGLDVLAGPDDPETTAWRLDLPPAPSTVRFGAWLEDPALPVAPDVAAVLDAAVARLDGAGLAVDRAARPPMDAGEGVAAFGQLIAAALSALGEDDGGPGLRHRDWLMLDETRQRQRRAWAELFRHVDVVLCPVFPVSAFPHQVDDDPLGIITRTAVVGDRVVPHVELIGWCGLIGVSFLPSTVVPVGFTEDGRPVGIQVVADFLHDRTALAAAARIERELGGFTPPPGFGG
jgi:amidase